jgi:hypothetical protein
MTGVVCLLFDADMWKRDANMKTTDVDMWKHGVAMRSFVFVGFRMKSHDVVVNSTLNDFVNKQHRCCVANENAIRQGNGPAILKARSQFDDEELHDKKVLKNCPLPSDPVVPDLHHQINPFLACCAVAEGTAR